MGDYQGDLADIVRASGYTAAEESDRYFPSNPINHFSHPASDFGDPFACTMRDPLLQNIDTPPSGSFYDSDITKAIFEQAGNTGGFSSSGANFAHKAALDDEMGRSSDIFSRMLQISPNTRLPVSVCESQAATASRKDQLDVPPVLVSNHHTLASPSSSKGRLVESPCLEISSPRNTGIRRRKNQAKKVVCIPAPAPANSRSSGEVVPSDLWAWRKYGQKPIKGSPYPRGYYRCSSSKGCLARKQVERSRNDPNMLVITYTSEHNHPWPTQRNALAGSIRSHSSKISSSAAKNSPNVQAQKPTNPNGEQKGISTENTAIYANSADVKEEMSQDHGDNELEKDEIDFHEGSLQSYKPTLSDSNNYSEDSFFSELGEINEADPLDFLFPRGYGGREYNALDPFSFYDWAANNDDITSAAAASISSTTSWRS